MLTQPPRLLTDGRDSVAGQTLSVQQEGDCDSEEAVKSQTVGLATTQCEIDIKEEEDEDWQLFKEAFEHDDCIASQAKAAADFLSSAVGKQIRQDLLTDLLLTVHDAQFESTSVTAEHRPAHIQEHCDQTKSTLSLDKLDSVEGSIDHILNTIEATEAFKETLSATGSGTPPLYEAYSADKAGHDLMQKLVACQMQKVRKPEQSTASVVEGAVRLESENVPTIPSTASSAG